MFVSYGKNHTFSFTLVLPLFSKDCVSPAEVCYISVALENLTAVFDLFRIHRPSSLRASVFNAIHVKT